MDTVARRVAPLKTSTWVTGPVVVAVSRMVDGAEKDVERVMLETVIAVGAMVMVPLAFGVME